MADMLLFMENEHYALVDALPYIDTQLGQTEVAQQVKALIDEEMQNFEPRDYLAPLPEPELPLLSGEMMQEEIARMEAGQPMAGFDVSRYEVHKPQGNNEQEAAAWRKAAENIQRQLEYNRLRLANLEMLERWGSKAWVAHSIMVRASERVLANEAGELKNAREEVNKKRKLDQISCGNELRKLTNELQQYQQDNETTQKAVKQLEEDVQRLRQAALDRGLKIEGLEASDAVKAGESEQAS